MLLNVNYGIHLMDFSCLVSAFSLRKKERKKEEKEGKKGRKEGKKKERRREKGRDGKGKKLSIYPFYTEKLQILKEI